jgi:hypothetical protein
MGPRFLGACTTQWANGARSLGAILVVAGSVSGCGLTRHWKMELDGEIPPTRAIKVMPAIAGVFVSMGFRDREGVETKSITVDPYGTQYHVYHVNIGAATANWLTRCLALSFASVVVIDPSSSREPPEPQPDFVFEPVDPKVTADQSATGMSVVASAQFTCNVQIRDRVGQTVADWAIEGSALKQGFFENMRLQVSNAALVDACAALTVRLQRERARFRPWADMHKPTDTDRVSP